MRILFINTPGHSRSTVTGGLLSNLNSAICLGETDNFFVHDLTMPNSEFTNRHCSCGELYQNCSFWADFPHSAFGDILDEYQLIIERCRRNGFETIIETCSKPECLELWKKTGLPITIIKMRKSFLHWYASMRKKEARNSKQKKSIAWYLRDYYLTKLLRRRYFTTGIKMNYYKLEALIGWENPSHHIAIGNRCKFSFPGSSVPGELRKILSEHK